MLNFLKNRPTFAQFAITYACNSRCSGCRYWLREGCDELSINEIKRLASELWDFGVRIVTITGGEPFMRKDAVDIIRLFFERGFRVTINTNGIVLDKELIGKLSDIGRLHIVVSLDSLDKDMYFRIRGVRALNTVLDTISHLKHESLHDVRVFTVVSSFNYREVQKIIDFCKANSCPISLYPLVGGKERKWFADQQMISSEEDKENIAALFEGLATRCRRDPTLFGFSGAYQAAASFLRGEHTGRCGAGEVLLQLSPDGRVSACPESEPFCDLRKESLKEAYIKMRWRPAVERCYKTTPCYIGCTRTLQSIRNAPLGFIAERFLKRF